MRRVLVCGGKPHHSSSRKHRRRPEEILMTASKVMNRGTELLAWHALIKAHIPGAIIIGDKARLPLGF